MARERLLLYCCEWSLHHFQCFDTVGCQPMCKNSCTVFWRLLRDGPKFKRFQKVNLYWKQQQRVNFVCAELLSDQLDVQRTVTEETNEMTQLVDGLILLYHMSAHKQLGKVSTCLFMIFFMILLDSLYGDRKVPLDIQLRVHLTSKIGFSIEDDGYWWAYYRVCDCVCTFLMNV